MDVEFSLSEGGGHTLFNSKWVICRLEIRDELCQNNITFINNFNL